MTAHTGYIKTICAQVVNRLLGFDSYINPIGSNQESWLLFAIWLVLQQGIQALLSELLKYVDVV